MESKPFEWPIELTKKLCQIRFENEWLFKQKKQPWAEFRQILLSHGFPENITIAHVRKKWDYTYNAYKIARKTNRKKWLYYKLFERHYGKKTYLENKFSSWNEEWRMKFVTFIHEAKDTYSSKYDTQKMWRAVENKLRQEGLPLDCCIVEIRNLWYYLQLYFARKHVYKIKNKDKTSDWPLYDIMYDYYLKHEPEFLNKAGKAYFFKKTTRTRKRYGDVKTCQSKQIKNEEFQWSKDITESFIQLRLQNDWMFEDRKQGWSNLRDMMVEKCSFPEILTGQDLCKKWAATYRDYQKAKATNNTSWLYYKLIEAYMEGGNNTLNPCTEWKEEWLHRLIKERTELNHLFSRSLKDLTHSWREVEKRLRSAGLPLDHSLLNLNDIWDYLLKTFRWKQTFERKGILRVKWPYYEAMTQFIEQKSQNYKPQKCEFDDETSHGGGDDYEDDMALFDLKQKLELDLKPKPEVQEVSLCRSCGSDNACVDIFAETGDNLPEKLRIICGVEVDIYDNLPKQICYTCLQDVENAWTFRQKCQEVDKNYRFHAPPVQQTLKIEVNVDEINRETNNYNDNAELDNDDAIDFEELPLQEQECHRSFHAPNVEFKKPIRKTTNKQKQYRYRKICEVCGAHTTNLKSHLDMHSESKEYSCDICGKKFKFKSGLCLHKYKHNPTPKKTCEICGKTFHSVAPYKRHFQYHANERKYECESCGKRFNTQDILRVHKRIHTDERAFSCSECGKTFRTAGCVSRHKRIVHRKIKKVKVP